jgi:hypothetical protein
MTGGARMPKPKTSDVNFINPSDGVLICRLDYVRHLLNNKDD